MKLTLEEKKNTKRVCLFFMRKGDLSLKCSRVFLFFSTVILVYVDYGGHSYSIMHKLRRIFSQPPSINTVELICAPFTLRYQITMVDGIS